MSSLLYSNPRTIPKCTIQIGNGSLVRQHPRWPGNCLQTGQGRVPLERGCSARATVTHGCALALHSLSATVCGPSKVRPVAFHKCPRRVRTSRLDSSQGAVNCSPSLFPPRDCPLLGSRQTAPDPGHGPRAHCALPDSSFSQPGPEDTWLLWGWRSQHVQKRP